jgi:hypothetical protein
MLQLAGVLSSEGLTSSLTFIQIRTVSLDVNYDSKKVGLGGQLRIPLAIKSRDPKLDLC